MASERTKAMDDLIAQDADLIDKLRDTDSYYRIQEKHWCIDHEELERQRLAAADRIEHLEQALGFAMRTLEAEGFRDDGPTLTLIRAALAGDSHDQ